VEFLERLEAYSFFGLCDGANYFKLGPVTKAYWLLDRYTTTRLRRWLCKKHKQSNGGTRRYPDEFLHQQMGLICLPQLPQSLPWAKA
jgi:hypothetical protein